MRQDNVIFAAIFAAFIVYITGRGELSTYLTILRGGGIPGETATQSKSSSSLGGIGEFFGGVADLFSGVGAVVQGAESAGSTATNGAFDAGRVASDPFRVNKKTSSVNNDVLDVFGSRLP